jgi:peroxiredoxin
MNRSVIAVFLLMMFLAVCAVVGGTPPAPLEIGKPAPAFSLKDVNGKDQALDQFLKDHYVVLMFIATQCPVSNDYNQRMVNLNDRYVSKGVVFVGINSNRQEGIDEIKEHSSRHKFTFPVLKDVDNIVADAYGAQVTPEVFVLDSRGVLKYHGRIDDGRDPDDIQSEDLASALDALLAGREVPHAETKAFGCGIKRIRKQG